MEVEKWQVAEIAANMCVSILCVCMKIEKSEINEEKYKSHYCFKLRECSLSQKTFKSCFASYVFS